jgi:galactosyl transferase GMA12/MNN10 family
MPTAKSLCRWLVTPARKILGQERMLDLFFGGYWLVRDLNIRVRPRVHGLAAPRIAMVSMWDAAHTDLAMITAPNKAAYCDRHGYKWLPCTNGFDPGRPTAWSKLLFLRRYLAHYDWIMWSDVDSLITNPRKRIEPLIRTNADLLLTRDKVGLNSGSFLIRNCRWAQLFLDEAWEYPAHQSYRLYYDLQTDRLWENRAFWMLLRHFDHRCHTRILPQRAINSYLPGLDQTSPKGAYAPGDFVLHLAGVNHATRLRVLADYAARSNQAKSA